MKDYVGIFFLSSILSLSFASDIDDFTLMLEELSDIATKKKINIEQIPSVVTVLHSEDLYTSGKRTVAEAISSIPGIDIWMTQTGWKMGVMRGNKNPESLTFDKIKLMVDGVEVNNQFFASTTYFMSFPIELIDRIDVLKGTGSAFYGAGAYAGVINIITKLNNKDNYNKVFVGAGSYNATQSGFVIKNNLNDIKFGIDGYYYNNNKKIDVGSNYVRDLNYFDRDFTTNEKQDEASIGFNLEYNGLTWRTRYLKQDNGNYFGFEEYLEPNPELYGNYHDFWFTQLEYDYHLSSKSYINLKAGIDVYDTVFDLNSLGEQSGYYISSDFLAHSKERKNYLDFSYIHNTDTQTFTIGLSYSYVKSIENSVSLISYMPEIDYEVTVYGDKDGNYPFYKDGISTKYNSIYLQDIIDITDNWIVNGGLRYDNYKDEFEHLSYQLGSAFNARDGFIYKVILSHGYRAASWIEQYSLPINGIRDGNNDLKEESVSGIEFSLNYKQADYKIDTNIYYSKLKDVIDITNTDMYGVDYYNYNNRISKGIESIYLQKISNTQKYSLGLNYQKHSYSDIRYLGETQDMPGVSNWSLKANYLNQITNSINFDISLKYLDGSDANVIVVEKERRDTLKDYDSTLLVDLITNYEQNQWSVQFGIYNILDKKIYQPSYRNRHIQTTDIASGDGILRESINFFGKIQYQF